MSWRSKTSQSREKVQMDRILREFPWFWAVDHSWAPGSCIVKFAPEDDITYFLQEEVQNIRWWIKIHRGEEERVISLELSPETTCAEAIGLAGDATVDYLVKRCPNGYRPIFLIFRMKPGALHTLCRALYWANKWEKRWANR